MESGSGEPEGDMAPAMRCSSCSKLEVGLDQPRRLLAAKACISSAPSAIRDGEYNGTVCISRSLLHVQEKIERIEEIVQ
jgi:hypothetical protein